MTGCQTEFSLSVSICAWCRPQERGDGLGAVSHGICLRHLRKLKLQFQGLLPEIPKKRSPRREHVAAGKLEQQLPF